MLSTVGGITINMGDIMSTVGILSFMGGIMILVGRYHEYHGGCSVPWRGIIFWNLSTVEDIMIRVGDIMSIVRGVQYHRGTQRIKDCITPRY